MARYETSCRDCGFAINQAKHDVFWDDTETPSVPLCEGCYDRREEKRKETSDEDY